MIDHPHGDWIAGCEGRYRIADDGIATSYVKDPNGAMLQPKVNGQGNLQYSLRINGKSKLRLIRRLVWETYKGEIPEGYEVYNINRDQFDNRVENLALRTAGERMTASWRRRKVAA